jgi:hypothetical protein
LGKYLERLKFKGDAPKELELVKWLKHLPLYGNYRDLQKIAMYYNAFNQFDEGTKKMLNETNAFQYAKNEFEKYHSPVVQLGKEKFNFNCGAVGQNKMCCKLGRFVGGFAALFILRRDSQTALPKFLFCQLSALKFDCCTVVLPLPVTFCSYPKVAISKHFTVNQAQTLIEAQSLI